MVVTGVNGCMGPIHTWLHRLCKDERCQVVSLRQGVLLPASLEVQDPRPSTAHHTYTNFGGDRRPLRFQPAKHCRRLWSSRGFD